MNRALALLQASLSAITDAVLPPRERTVRTRELSPERVPLTPASHELLRTHITTLMDYRDERVRDLIQSLKYDGNARAAQLCAATLADYLLGELADAHTFSAKQTLLVPVPLHLSRERERGFNQIALVLQALPAEFRAGPLSSLCPEALERTRPTAPQTHFARSQRLSNVAGAFAARDTVNLKGAHIYLIDDVATTGATLVNAATPLRRAGAEVSLTALARA